MVGPPSGVSPTPPTGWPVSSRTTPVTSNESSVAPAAARTSVKRTSGAMRRTKGRKDMERLLLSRPPLGTSD